MEGSMHHYLAIPCCGEREATSARQFVEVVSTYSEISIVTIPMERRWCVGGLVRFTGGDLSAFYLIQVTRVYALLVHFSFTFFGGILALKIVYL